MCSRRKVPSQNLLIFNYKQPLTSVTLVISLPELRETVSTLLEEKKNFVCQIHEQQRRIDELTVQVRDLRATRGQRWMGPSWSTSMQ